MLASITLAIVLRVLAPADATELCSALDFRAALSVPHAGAADDPHDDEIVLPPCSMRAFVPAAPRPAIARASRRKYDPLLATMRLNV